MKKIGLATPVYNVERWIYPFLKLTSGIDRRVLVLGDQPVDWLAKEHGISYEPDRTEPFVKKYFPDVEIIKQRPPYMDDADFWNQGHEHLADDCDFIFRFDADEMIMPKYWEMLLDRARNSNDKSIAVDFGKSAIEYYYDMDHGRKNVHDSWVETRGLRSDLRYTGKGAFDLSTAYVFSARGFWLYHYTGWKRGELDKEKILDNTEEEWLGTPRDLVKLFTEGWRKLEEL